MRETLSDLFRETTRDRARALLTLVGIAIGSASVVVLDAELQAADAAVTTMAQAATGEDVSRLSTRAPQGDDVTRAAHVLGARDADAVRAQQHLPGGAVADGHELLGRRASRGTTTVDVGVQSGGGRLGQLSGVALRHGRWPSPDEDGQRVCVIGHEVWDELFAGQWPVPSPAVILDGRTRFTVVGVARSHPALGGGGGDRTWALDRKVWVSSATFLRSIDPDPAEGALVLRHPSVDGRAPDLRRIAERLTPFLRELHGADDVAFDALDGDARLGELIGLALVAVLFACGGVALVVGGVNVMNAQMVAVEERTQELGVRRALGATARTLGRAVLLETCAFTLLGGLLGVLAGVMLSILISAVVTRLFVDWPLRLSWYAPLAALAVSAAAGAIAGRVPARRAARVSPTECLRSA